MPLPSIQERHLSEHASVSGGGADLRKKLIMTTTCKYNVALQHASEGALEFPKRGSISWIIVPAFHHDLVDLLWAVSWT